MLDSQIHSSLTSILRHLKNTLKHWNHIRRLQETANLLVIQCNHLPLDKAIRILISLAPRVDPKLFRELPQLKKMSDRDNSSPTLDLTSLVTMLLLTKSTTVIFIILLLPGKRIIGTPRYSLDQLLRSPPGRT